MAGEGARNKHQTRRHEEGNGGSYHVACRGLPLLGGGKATSSEADPKFWSVVLETFSGKKLKKKEANRMERRAREVTGWGEDRLRRSHVRELRDSGRRQAAGKAGGAGPSGSYDTKNGPKRNDATPAGSQEREKVKIPSF